MRLTTESIAATYEGFREERGPEVTLVRGWIQRVVRSGSWRFHDPEAAVQDILLKIVEAVRQDRVTTPGGFRKFVDTVAKRMCVNVYHRDRRRRDREIVSEEIDDVPADRTPEQPLEERRQLEMMVVIYQQLPTACRELWSWVYAENRSADEVAETLGVTINNVRVRVHRCLQKAREIRDRLGRAPLSVRRVS